MSQTVAEKSNRAFREPGTCKQTGNHAPRFHWPGAIRVLIHRIAHHLGATDDEMMRLAKWPPTKSIYELFVATVPWFPDDYDTSQIAAAEAKGYDGPLHLFKDGHGAEKIHNRLRYLFETPKHGKVPRRYGKSAEHFEHPQGNRRKVDLKCSKIILRYLTMRKIISKAQIERWSSED